MAAITIGRYALFSCFAAVAVLAHAFATRRQFFPAMYFLGTCKLSIAILGNFILMSALLFHKLVTWIYLGRLRESEVERINERLHHGVVEICLTLTVFRQDFDGRLIWLMGGLAMVKVFHWLIQDRINYMQTEPVITRLQHVRTASFLSILLAVDIMRIHGSVSAIMKGDKGYQILFMFEYTILACMAVACFVKYGLAVVDNASSEPWPNKGLYLIYLELAMDTITFVLYMAFFGMIMHRYFTIPLHLIRDIYMAYLSLARRVANYSRYRSVSSKLHQLRDATPDDLERVGRSCIICREDMSMSEGLKKLHCDHVFHLSCLRSWLERQQTCPICRTPIVISQRTATTPAAAAPAPQPADGRGDNGLPAAHMRAPVAAAAGQIMPEPALDGNQRARNQPNTQQAGTADPAPGQDGQAGPAAAAEGIPPSGTTAAPAGSRSNQPPTFSSAAAQGIPRPRAGVGSVRGLYGYGPWNAQGPSALVQGLPHDSPAEMRAAFNAASKAFARLAPYYMPIYEPFGAEVHGAANSDMSTAPGVRRDQATGEALRSVPSGSADASGAADPQNPQYERARRAASAAVAASIAATRELLQGQIALLKNRLERLDLVETAALGEEPAT